MANKQKEIEPENVVTVRHGRQTLDSEVWRYYTVVNILRQFGATREEANEAADWARKAKPGDTRQLWPSITMEVHDGRA